MRARRSQAQECFSDGYTPVTASTAVTLGNVLLKEGSCKTDGRINQARDDVV